MIVVMYVVRVPNRGSPPATLLRESYREDGKVKNRTLANLSSWPEAKVDALTRVLKGRPPPAADLDGAFEITRSLPHGHVAAVLGTARAMGLEELIDPVPSRQRDLVTAMAAAQVIAPDSKLAIARGLRDATAASSLGEVLHLGSCDEDDLYAAMDYLHARQDTIQDALAARHLADGTLVLYDVSTAAFEGRTCPLGAIGHPKDGVRGRLQIVYGLLTSKDGIPVAIEVFKGNTGDPTTVASQVDKLKDRFGIGKVVLVGDRGMLTAARLREDVRPAGLDWITALRAPQVKALVRDGDLQLTLFDTQDLAEITSPDFPGERLVACMNPFLEAERARKRESLLAATEADLEKIAAACARARRPLRGKDKIAVRADRVLKRRKVAKHFTVDIGEDSFSYARDQDSIAAEAKLDGIYVVRTSVQAPDLDNGEIVSSYKALAQVERAFRAFNTDLDIRPIRHRTEDRVRAHVFLRMLSYYLSWHLQARLAPLLFTDDDKQAAQTARTSPVAPAARSPRARAKAATKHTPAAQPVHSLATLLSDLGTICLNTIAPADPALPGFQLVTTPTALQRQTFELLGVSHRLGVA
ncbi:IS1634 family transposase [Trebonia sp.]|uniref:IS1634 family transposase n=1 Tax=Trebonia sp. TaxID=2767075 RepID=UPI002629F7DB|nr:IS1634 family transposase [Trebonia sp.]